MKRLLATVSILALAFAAQAQAPMQQSGSVVKNHAASGRLAARLDAGPRTGGDANVGITDLPLLGTGTPLCIYDAPVTSSTGYHSLCFGANDVGNSVIKINSSPPATPIGLVIDINGTTYPFPGTGAGNVLGPATSTANEIASFNDTTGTTLRQGPAAITDNKAVGITSDAAGLTISSNTTYTANQLYRMTTPVAVSTYDAIRGIAVATPGTTTEGVNGVAGYAIGTKPQGGPGTGGNPAGLFGLGIAANNNSSVWGINTLLTDNTSQVASAGAARELWNEFDFNVTSPNTTVRGLVLTGASIAQPALSVGVEIRPLGSGIEWTTALATQNGAAVNGLAIGTQAEIAGAPSQLFLMGWNDGSNITQNFIFQADAGVLTIDSSGAANTGSLALAKGGFRTTDGGSTSGLVLGRVAASGPSASQPLFLDWTNAGGVPFTHQLQTSNAGVLNLISSGAAPSGSFNIAAGTSYRVGGVVGVSCSGAPTAGFTSVGGIVTAC